MSSVEAEYVAAAGCCIQVLWIKSQLANYDVLYDKPVTQPKAPTDLMTKKKRIPPSSKPESQHKVRVILPKKKVTKTQHAEDIVATFDITKSLVPSELAKEQGNQPSTAEAEKILEGKLVCLSAKKQSYVTMSSVEAEYVAAAGCCIQVLWIKSQLANYDVLYDKTSDPISCLYKFACKLDTLSSLLVQMTCELELSSIPSLPASDNLSVGGYEWAIYFYSDGEAEDKSTYVSIFIALASDATDVWALFELTFLDQSGKDKLHTDFDGSLETGPYTLQYRGSSRFLLFGKDKLHTDFDV
nr:hypothetical protein [Tanacetum cinerariifolium]